LAGGATDNRDCWCFHEYFPPALLARVPPAARNRACICPACLKAATAAKAIRVGAR